MQSSIRRTLILVTLAALALTACSSAGYSTKASMQVPRVIRAPFEIPPELAPHFPRFVEMLQSKGFTVEKTDNPRALDLVFEFNGNPFNLRVSAGLWRDGIPILSASATNSGWGTALARGSAVNSLVDSAAQVFQTELNNMMANTRIVADGQ